MAWFHSDIEKRTPSIVKTTKSVVQATPYYMTGIGFSITDTKTGYTPLMATLRYYYAGKVFANIENLTMDNGSVTAQINAGFIENTTVNVTYFLDVLWIENI